MFSPGDARRKAASPPWRQPRGKSMVSLVSSHTNATRIGWHLGEIDLRFAPGLPPGWWTQHPRPSGLGRLLLFCLTLVTGPRGSLSLKLSDTKVYEPPIRARLGTTAHFCGVVVLKLRGGTRSLSRARSLARLFSSSVNFRISSTCAGSPSGVAGSFGVLVADLAGVLAAGFGRGSVVLAAGFLGGDFGRGSSSSSSNSSS